MASSLRRKYWSFSPLTLHIMLVNVTALFILALAFLYTGQYERELIRNELEALSSEAQLLAASIAEGGVQDAYSMRPVLSSDLSRPLIRRLIDDSSLRLILFDKSGEMLLDSHQMMGAGGVVQMAELPPPVSSMSLDLVVDYHVRKILSLLPTRLNIPFYPQVAREKGHTYPDVSAALNGESRTRIWRDDNGEIVLTATAPIQQLKTVLGGILVLRSGENIDATVEEVQKTALIIFFWVLLITVLMSLNLSTTIVNPLMKLARAADDVRHSLNPEEDMMKLARRNDEIGLLSAAFMDMTQALSDRMDAIKNFSADVAHEIKNPMASVRSAIETLSRVEDPVKQKQLIDIIQQDIQRMNRLINDISAASRLDSELSRTDKEEFDLVTFLKNQVDVFFARQSDPIEHRLSLNHEPLMVLASDTQLSQVIQNLLSNAVSFTPDGGAIEIGIKKDRDRAIVWMENEGPAIPDGKLETIFQRFYTERPTSEGFGLHSGLGLSISRDILKSHGGTIYATNMQKPDGTHRGVRFTVIIPLA